MEKIHRLNKNPLSDRTISTPHIIAFGFDCYPKLESEFPAEAEAIRLTAERANKHRADVMKSGATRISDTAEVDRLLDQIQVFMSESEDRISADLGKDSALFAVIYPNGLRTYSQLTKTDAPAQLLALANAADDANGKLHEPTRLRLAEFQADWARLHLRQQQTEGELGENREERDEEREALEDACYEAMLQVARKNKRDPNAGRRYFDHTILDPDYTPSLRKPRTAS